MIKNLKKEIIFITVMILMSFLLIPQITDAKFLDIWNSITGKASSQTASISISIGNNPPVIGNVTLDMADSVSITEAGNKSFFFSFIATDPDGLANIENNSAVANISRGGEATRYNDTFIAPADGGCDAVNNIGANGKNFSCTIRIVFYDGAGQWKISVRINDSNGNFAQNTTKNFTIQESTNIVLDSSTFSFPSVTPNQYNITSTTLIAINNTGNDDIDPPLETLNITAITLAASGTATFIPAANFSMGTDSSSQKECDTSLGNTTRFSNTTSGAPIWANFTGTLANTTLPAQATGNREELELCLLHAPNDLTTATYSTATSGVWTILAF